MQEAVVAHIIHEQKQVGNVVPSDVAHTVCLMENLRRGVAILAIATSLVGCGSDKNKTSSSVETPPGPRASSASSTPPEYGSASIFYAGAMSEVTATGASVDLEISKPLLGTGGLHSLAEIALRTDDNRQAIELGWMVAKQFGDDKPHLFVFSTKDGVQNSECYHNSACGFVPLPGAIKAGSVIPAGTTQRFKIAHSEKDHEWQVFYNDSTSLNNTEFGYFNDSYWNNTFTEATNVAIFGEVAVNHASVPCAQMGSGQLGAADSNRIGQPTYVFESQENPLPLTIFVDPQTSYYKADYTPDGIRFGGPGAEC